ASAGGIGKLGDASMRTGANSGSCCPFSEMPRIPPAWASFFHAYSWLRLIPLRSATADTVAPGSSASAKILTFRSALHFRRRSTREMISPTLSIAVLTHVSKDAKAHDLG